MLLRWCYCYVNFLFSFPLVTAAIRTSAAAPMTDAAVMVHTTASTSATEPVVVTTSALKAPPGDTVMFSAARGSMVTPTLAVMAPISTPAVVPLLGVRLLKLMTQPIDGNVTQWTSFWD